METKPELASRPLNISLDCNVVLSLNFCCLLGAQRLRKSCIMSEGSRSQLEEVAPPTVEDTHPLVI